MAVTFSGWNTSTNDINEKLGVPAVAGTSVFKLLEGLGSSVSNLVSHISNWTAERAAKLDNLDAAVSSRAPSNTALSNATWTNTRAGYLDNIRSYTITNNTANKTGVLSQKLSYIVSLLENATYGLSAIKNSAGGKASNMIYKKFSVLDKYTSGNYKTLASLRNIKVYSLGVWASNGTYSRIIVYANGKEVYNNKDPYAQFLEFSPNLIQTSTIAEGSSSYNIDEVAAMKKAWMTYPVSLNSLEIKYEHDGNTPVQYTFEAVILYEQL